MRKLLLAAVAVLALGASGSLVFAAPTANYPPVMNCDPNTGSCGQTTSQSFSISTVSSGLNAGPSAAGTSAWLALGGQGACTVTFTQSDPSASVTVQGASDAPSAGTYTPQTVTGVNSNGVIAPPVVGTAYGGTVIPQATTFIRLNVTNLATGTVAGSLSCTSASGISGGGGGSGSGGTVQVSPLPLPVAPTGGPYAVSIASPVPVSPPTCAAAPNAPCVQVTGPVTVNTPAPYVAPTASPGGFPAMQPLFYGTGATYVGAYPDTTTAGTAITATGTYQQIAGVAGQNIYVFYAATFATAANTSASGQWIAGSGTLCGTNTVFPFGPGGSQATTVGNYELEYGGVLLWNNPGRIYPAAVPYVIPAGDSICFNVTAGTSLGIVPLLVTAQH